jgi:hypothetical protein
MHPVDPDPGQIGERREVVVRGQQLGLEAAHLAGRGAAALDGLAADDPAHRRIAPETVGVVHVLVAGEAAVDGLAQQIDEAVPAILAGATVGDDIARQRAQPEDLVEFAIGQETSVGSDARPVELQLQAAVENGP